MDWFFDRIVRDRVVPIPGTSLYLLPPASYPPTIFPLSPFSYFLPSTSFLPLPPSLYLLPPSFLYLLPPSLYFLPLPISCLCSIPPSLNILHHKSEFVFFLSKLGLLKSLQSTSRSALRSAPFNNTSHCENVFRSQVRYVTYYSVPLSCKM